MDAPTPRPAFAADVMLGKTARWLRLLGFDTYYSNRAGDDFLKELAERQGRILLTRDTGLHARMPAGRSHLVAADRPGEQLREIVGRFQLDRHSPAPRCSRCNGELQAAGREEAQGLVPPFVWRTQARFSRCRECRRFYWAGTHLPRIQQTLRRLVSKVDERPRETPDGTSGE